MHSYKSTKQETKEDIAGSKTLLVSFGQWHCLIEVQSQVALNTQNKNPPFCLKGHTSHFKNNTNTFWKVTMTVFLVISYQSHAFCCAIITSHKLKSSIQWLVPYWTVYKGSWLGLVHNHDFDGNRNKNWRDAQKNTDYPGQTQSQFVTSFWPSSYLMDHLYRQSLFPIHFSQDHEVFLKPVFLIPIVIFLSRLRRSTFDSHVFGLASWPV